VTPSAGTGFTLRPLIRAKCRNLTGHGPDGKKKVDVFLPSESDVCVGSLGKAGFQYSTVWGKTCYPPRLFGLLTPDATGRD